MTGEVIQVHGGSRVTVGYLAYMHHITEQLAADHASRIDNREGGDALSA